MTITNFLEGNVPEATSLQKSPGFDHLKSENNATVPTATARSTDACREYRTPNVTKASRDFPMSAYERMDYFQKRKAVLIESARRKYLEKHNIKINSPRC